jgi:hypothetical protein
MRSAAVPKRKPPKGGTPNLRRWEFRIHAVLNPRLVPILSVLAQGIRLPDTLRLFNTRLRQLWLLPPPQPHLRLRPRSTRLGTLRCCHN